MWEVRKITDAEVELFRARLSRGFGRDNDTDQASRERFAAVFERDRVLAAFDGDDIVGTCAALSLGVTVPGGAVVPMGGTTIVTVQPTHRRRGVLRAMMESHFDDISGRDEPLAGLWASEGSIYGRFGYALATHRHMASMSGSSLEFLDDPPADHVVRLVETDEAAPIIRDLYEQAMTRHPGMLTRSDAWWDHRLLADPESWRGDKSAWRYAIVEDGGMPVGYATYRQKNVWDDFVSRGEVHVGELIAFTPGARRGLWGFLTRIDLFPQVEWWNMPLDDPLPAVVSSSRLIRRTLGDALWVRVMDVTRALEARAYETDGEVSFEARDSIRPENTGTYRLEVREGRARCERVTTEPEISFEIDVLGHIYLGGGNAVTMADAGRLSGPRDVIERLHRIFRTDVAPWCNEVF